MMTMSSVVTNGAVLAVCFALTAAAAPAEDIRPVQGPVILAKAGASAEYLWNATAFVAQMTTDKLFGDDAVHALESTAVVALADKSKTSAAASVSIKVIYAKTGEVSPVYRAATFTGMENVFTITAPRADLAKHAAEWSQQIAHGHVPAAVKLNLTGKLPPAQ
jgi:hypothetical protein